MEIRYLRNEQIDREKWDQCIKASKSPLIYAESEYIDHMAEHWDSLILGDYEAVMPLIWRKKLGIRYLFQPAFTQQGGIFSKKDLSLADLDSFIQLLTQHFRFAEIALNYANLNINSTKDLIISTSNNYIIDLKRGYNDLESGYDSYTKIRIKRAKKNNLYYFKEDHYEKAIRLYQSIYTKRIGSIKKVDFERFEKLCKSYESKGKVVVRSIHQSNRNEPLAMLLLLKDEHRIYNLMSSITEAGKKHLANYYLFDRVFQEFSGQGLVFDFEGSDIPGIAFFYKKFATANQQYPFLRYNNLPFIIKLLKR